MENAVLLPIKQVIDLADVEDVDIFKIEKLETGIKELDRLLYGGLPCGGVILVSGKPGEGKSTLTSQILARAIKSGKICFAYSGELPNYMFKSWLDFQIAGRGHVYEYQNKWGDNNYALSKTNRDIISEWYRGKCYLYDNRFIDGDEKDNLIKLIQDIVMQYGVQVVLIDNLMTALDLDSSRAYDKYDRQSIFVKKLARIALNHNIWILLVAHKRKNNFSANENDEVSGSGDITNLALVTIAYERGKDIEPEQRLLKVSKNRLFGRTNTEGYILNFDEKSKRIYGKGDNPDYDFGWENLDPENVEEETPFD